MKKYLFIIITLIILSLLAISYFIIINKDKYNVISTYNNPIIPIGFHAVESENASWNLENSTPKGWNDGLIIEDENGNQFVWIPIDIKNLNYSKYNKGYTEITAKYDINNLNINNIEEAQILKFGGFYVSRYEAGVSEEMQRQLTNIDKSTNDVEGIPTSKKGFRVWNYISSKNAIKNAANMYNTKEVKSGLISLNQWIVIMEWIQKKGFNVYENSSAWGNYSNVNFEFTGLYSEDQGKSYKYGTNKLKSVYNMILSSGSSDRNMSNNIYDLAGNLREYTNTYAESGYYCVGGHYTNTGEFLPAGENFLTNTVPLDKVGFRIVLNLDK